MDRKYLVHLPNDLSRPSGKAPERRGRGPSHAPGAMRTLHRVWEQTGCFSSERPETQLNRPIPFIWIKAMLTCLGRVQNFVFRPK